MPGSRLPHDSGAMGTHIVILGGGTGGTLTANRLRRMYDEDDCRITVVDQDDDHVYQPGLLFVPFGAAQPHHLVRSRPQQLHAAVDYKQARIERVDLDARTVHLSGGIRMTYDVLVVATGATLLPEETEGLTGPGWGEKVFTFYDLPGAVGLHHALERLEGGRVVVNVADLPIKCPVAPLEFAFLADWYFQRRGIRDKVQLTCVTPLDGAFTKPVAAEALGGLLAAKGIELVTEFTLGEVDGEGGRLVSYARCPSTWRWSCRCTAAPSTSNAPRASATNWASSLSTSAPSNTPSIPRCSRSATRPGCLRPRPVRWRTSRGRRSRTTSAASWPDSHWMRPSTRLEGQARCTARRPAETLTGVGEGFRSRAVSWAGGSRTCGPRRAARRRR